MIAAKLRGRFGRLSTSVKMLAIMTLALMPLGAVALLASVEANRSAGEQRQSGLRIAAAESAARLGAVLAADVATMRIATNAIALGGSPEESCARMASIRQGSGASSPRLALFGPASDPICASATFKTLRPSTVALELGPRTVFAPDGLDIIVPATNGTAVAIAHYPARRLAAAAQPTHLGEDTALTLESATESLALYAPRSRSEGEVTTKLAPIGQLGLTLALTVRTLPVDTPRLLLAFLPLLMWASAAAVIFLLVERLLIRPLRELRAAVAEQVPGQPFAFTARTPAREIRELGETFARGQLAIATQQDALSSALANQMRATREVHHRVKNNLQIIASLINLHAGSATANDAIGAYAAIQRRVDALAIVHRNHYAEMDGARGIDLRRLLGEIAANLRVGGFSTGAPPAPISIAAGTVAVSQDVAIALAFLVTELIELSNASMLAAEINLSVAVAETHGRASITIQSAALRSTPLFEDRLTSRYARVIEGLSRQLRAPIRRNKRLGSFSIEFAAVADLA